MFAGRPSVCLWSCAGSIITLALMGSAASAQINVSTGQDASGNIIGTGGALDAHWTVPPDGGGAPAAAQTVFPNNADWFGGWYNDSAQSDWIARDANVTDNGPAPYTFSTTFDLSNYLLSTATLGGFWAIDDAGTLSLNGNVLGSLGSGEWGGPTAFGAPSSDFVQGVNTLSITITSDDDYLEGVRLEGSVNATPALTPEPGATALFGSLGLCGIGLLLRRRSRTSA